MKSIFVFGPPGSGKTTNAERIQLYLGMPFVHDEWEPGDPFDTEDTVIFTCWPNSIPGDYKSIGINYLLSEMKGEGKGKMKRYRISRVYAMRWNWTVAANSEKEALAMLDDDSKTPTDSAEEDWLGPVGGITMVELPPEFEDRVSEI